MTIRNFSDFLALLVREGEGVGSGTPAPTEGGDVKPDAGTKADAGSVLFPNEGEKKPVDPAGKEGEPAPEWKEYEADPAKTDEENAAAKAEHDKTKPDEKGEKKDQKPDPLDTVPEDGKYALTMPEGVELDQGMLDALAPDFKEAGLTTRQVQVLADKLTAYQQSQAEAANTRFAETVAKWADDAKADKDIGGDNWATTTANAQKAISKLATPALKEYLEATGGGNHPELIRFASRVGALLREDSPPKGGAGGGGKPADTAHILYANDAPKG